MTMLARRISVLAANDLVEIWLFTAKNWSPVRADRYYRMIIKKIDRLQVFPQAGRPVDHIRPGYRMVKVGVHQIYYRITDEQIDVIRILNARMDATSRLSENNE